MTTDAKPSEANFLPKCSEDVRGDGCTCPDCPHASDCAVHNGPAYPPGPCTCGVAESAVEVTHHVPRRKRRVAVSRPRENPHSAKTMLKHVKRGQELIGRIELARGKQKALGVLMVEAIAMNREARGFDVVESDGRTLMNMLELQSFYCMDRAAELYSEAIRNEEAS